MAELNSKHVTWGGLQYYDSQIKKYIDDIVVALQNSSELSEDIEQLKERIDSLLVSVNVNQSNIEALFNENTENEFLINKLVDSDKINTASIEGIQARLEYLATSESVAQVSGTLTELLNTIDRLEEFVRTDHITLEQLQINLKDKADIDYVNAEISKISAPDLSNYATKEYVAQEILKAELGDTDFDETLYYTKSEIDTMIPDVSDFVTSADIEDLASKNYVDTAVSNVKVDLTGYATETWVQTQGYLTDVPDNYVTETELDAKGYLTEHQSLSEYAKLTDIPDVSNFATKDELPSIEGLASIDYVDTKISEINVPDVSAFVTQSSVESMLLSKADNILFTTPQYVNNPVGDFKQGDSVEGLTLKQILTKLLSLKESDEPEDPDVPKTVVETIISEQIPMYSISGFTVVEVPYTLYTYTEDEASLDRNESGFYQIKDANGVVIESGYQDVQTINSEAYYIFALPKIVDFESMVTVQVYSLLHNDWVDAGGYAGGFTATNDLDYIRSICSEDPQMFIDAVNTDEYTIWMQEAVPNGAHYRFVIKE